MQIPLSEGHRATPCLTLRHVKDPKMAWKSSFRLNLPDNILAHGSTLRY